MFTYLGTNADLLNQLYVELKTEMASAALEGIPTGKNIRSQMASMWSGWVRWATAYPDKRRTLAHLAVSDEITGTSRQIGNRAMAGVSEILERSRKNGPMRAAPLGLVAGWMNAAADATVDFIVRDRANERRGNSNRAVAKSSGHFALCKGRSGLLAVAVVLDGKYVEMSWGLPPPR